MFFARACMEAQVYTTHWVRADGTKAWAGGKHLALSASFTGWFCRALLKCWLQARQEEAARVQAFNPPENLVIGVEEPLSFNPPENQMVGVEGPDPNLNQ